MLVVGAGRKWVPVSSSVPAASGRALPRDPRAGRAKGAMPADTAPFAGSDHGQGKLKPATHASA
jgi:hypothetical protein